MIKRLRAKFILVTMALVTAMLLVILGMVCEFTHRELEERSLVALRAVSEGPMRPGKPLHGSVEIDPHHPCFVLKWDPSGLLEVEGGEFYYDLPDTQTLQTVLALAKQSGEESGVLWQYSLRFCRLDKLSGRYAFMDISTEIQTMQTLTGTCLLIGAAAFVAIFILVWLLSKWVVRPVEEAWIRQRQFVADASHELKTPLTVILTNAEMLQDGDFSTADRQRFAGSILTMATQMRGLVESMLELARGDQGGMQKQFAQVDLSELTEDCVLPFEPVYFESGRTLESQVAPGIIVKGSQGHLRQVVDILLDNGCKYADPGTTVVLTLERLPHDKCLLRVESRGETMTEVQCRDIFKRFYRADEARAMNRSYGLGLPIAEAIVTEHKGKIWCQSKDGVNTFYVTLPSQHS